MCGAGDHNLQLANLKGRLLEVMQPNTAANDPRRRCAEVQNLTVPAHIDYISTVALLVELGLMLHDCSPVLSCRLLHPMAACFDTSHTPKVTAAGK